MKTKKKGSWAGVGVVIALISVIAGACIGVFRGLFAQWQAANEPLDLGPRIGSGMGLK